MLPITHARGLLGPFPGADWPVLAALVVLAGALRTLFYTGYFGSDEVTYIEAALAASRGEWLGSSYIGAIRLGVNYPIAALVRALGTSEMAVAAWGFTCSVVEVAVVYWFARRAFDRRIAVIAAALLAFTPLHVHFAGRVMADAPLALFMTLTFVVFFVAESSGRRRDYLLAGAFAGCVFWIKEGTTIFVGAFALWAVYRRRLDRCWIWSLLAAAVVVGANSAAMWYLSGNPFFLIESVRASLHGNVLDTTAADRIARATAWYYLRYLFIDVWHTWLLGFLAAIGAVVAFLQRRSVPARADALAYVFIWAIGLLAIFSLFPLSLSPLRLIPKQSNYMTIFLAPLCVLGGIAIAAIGSALARGAVLAVVAAGAVLLCALEQQTIHAFTANSAPTIEYAARHPSTAVYVVANAARRNVWAGLLPGTKPGHVGNVHSMQDLFGGPGTETRAPRPPDAVAIVDPQTIGWGQNGIAAVSDIPPCWVQIESLPPQVRDTLGRRLTTAAAAAASLLPARVARPAMARFVSLTAPSPAQVYRIPETCQ